MYDHGNAQFRSNLGIPVFACSPDKFPDLMLLHLVKQDITIQSPSTFKSSSSSPTIFFNLPFNKAISIGKVFFLLTMML